jgi:hypothetical protein
MNQRDHEVRMMRVTRTRVIVGATLLAVLLVGAGAVAVLGRNSTAIDPARVAVVERGDL